MWVCLAEMNTSSDDKQARNNAWDEMLKVKFSQKISTAGLFRMGFSYMKRLNSYRYSEVSKIAKQQQQKNPACILRITL